MSIEVNLGGHLVSLVPAKCSSSGNDRCLTSVESEKLFQWFCQCRAVTNICEELHFLWRFHMSCSWQDWWGWLPPCIITLVKGWKAAVVKAAHAAAYADSSVVTCALVMQCYSSFLLYFTSLNDFGKRVTAYEQEEAAGKQFLLISAHNPIGENRSFTRTLWFA